MTYKKNIFRGLLFILLVVGVLGLHHFIAVPQKQPIASQPIINNQEPLEFTSYSSTTTALTHQEKLIFVYPAKKATPAVVHITSKYEAKVMQRGTNSIEELFKEFLGEGFELGPKEYKTQPGAAFGSGVIISEDGYIVTNNHVIDKADQIEVTLDDNRRYIAKLVGVDPDTDLALLKIDETKLSYLLFGNSDDLQVGEWVLAVGNPFHLTSTATQGIVSAKARRTGMYQSGSGMKIEAFIQISAAVNRGSSGGALVNLEGELVGINTAISTPNGAFTGYSLAIPSSIVQRVVSDLKRYGTVQRAILGIFPVDVNADLVQEKKLKRYDGVYVNGFSERSAAAEGGVKEGDIVIAINKVKVKNLAQLHEQLTSYKPGDVVNVTIDRKGKELLLAITLKNALNEIKLVHGQDSIEVEGATFEQLNDALKKKLGIKGGTHIKAIKTGKWKEKGVKQGFILLTIDKETIESLDHLATVLNSKKGPILVEGIYSDGKKACYAIEWGDL